MPSRFSKMLGDANAAQDKPTDVPSPADQGSSEGADLEGAALKAQFYDEITNPERVATIRLNFDIPVELDDRLKAKAKQLRTTKTALVRKMIEFMLKE